MLFTVIPSVVEESQGMKGYIEHMTKTYIAILCLLCLVVVADVVFAVPADRAKGGTHDGHAKSIVVDTPVWVPVAGTVILIQ